MLRYILILLLTLLSYSAFGAELDKEALVARAEQAIFTSFVVVIDQLIEAGEVDTAFELAKEKIGKGNELMSGNIKNLYELFETAGRKESGVEILRQYAEQVSYSRFVYTIEQLIEVGEVDTAFELAKEKIGAEFGLLEENVKQLYELFKSAGRRESGVEILKENAEQATFDSFVYTIEQLIEVGEVDTAFELAKEKIGGEFGLLGEDIEKLKLLLNPQGDLDRERELLELDIERVIVKVNDLQREGKRNEASEYGSKVLEVWEKKPDELVLKKLKLLLMLAIASDSEYYYNSLKNKASRWLKEGEVFKEDGLIKFEPYWKTLDLGEDTSGGASMVEVLISRMRLDPSFEREYEISREMFRYGLEHILYELSKKMSRIEQEDAMILFEVLNAIAIDFLRNPQERMYLFLEHPETVKTWVGIFRHDIKSVSVSQDIGDRFEFQGTLMHELTHKLMYVLFRNNSLPYWHESDSRAEDMKNNYIEAITTTKELLENYKQKKASSFSLFSAIKVLNEVTLYNTETERRAEYIVRLVQIVALGYYEDPEVKKLMQPLSKYWNEYVRPEIDRYTKDNADYDKFSSELLREHLFDPIYSEAIPSEGPAGAKDDAAGVIKRVKYLMQLGNVEDAFELAKSKMNEGFSGLDVEDVWQLNEIFESEGLNLYKEMGWLRWTYQKSMDSTAWLFGIK